MKIVIFGANGQAKESIDLIEENTKGKIIGLIDKKPFKQKVLGYSFLGTDEQIEVIIKKHRLTHFFVAIGDLATRSKIYSQMSKKLKPLSIFSKKAIISKYAKFGDHVIVYPGVTINADVTVGTNVYINSNVSIGHEVKIGDHVNINPGANIAGKVIIGNFCTVGIGASVKEKLTIADNTFIGGGAMVTKGTKPNKIYVGVPAKIMSKNES